MATIYVRSTDGSDADNGSTWALAKATGVGAAAIDVAGDVILFSQVHAETTAGNVTMPWAGTILAPTRLICANDVAEPPVDAATTATVTVTGAASRIEHQGNLYCYGVSYINNGTGNAPIWLSGANNRQVFEKCSFQINSATASTIFLNSSGATTGDTSWSDCSVKFGAVGSFIRADANRFRWEGGSVLAGGTTPTSLFSLTSTRYANIVISGVDFSNLGTGFFFAISASTGSLIVKNCKLPASWTGDLYNGVAPQSARFEMYNCDSGDTIYRMRVKDFAGDAREETTIVRTGGATDGTTAYSWKISTTVNCNRSIGRFDSPDLYEWNATAGMPITLTIDVLRDSVVNLKTADIGLKIEYLGTSGSPLSLFASSAPDNPLSAGADLPSSSATWITTSMSNPNKQKIEVTFTPQKSGPMRGKIVTTIASTTIYADPEIQVS